MRRTFVAALLLPFALSACELFTGSEGTGNVVVGFSTSSATGSASYSASASGAETLVISGSNGTLTITEIRLVVDEFKLERAEAGCERLEGGAAESCETFEAPPAFVNLPLVAGAAVGASQAVPAGSYSALKFETQDLDAAEESDAGKAAAIQRLSETVRAAYPNWPADASLVVVGDFNGTPFTVFLAAEVKVEKAFDSALVVDEANSTVTVEVDPSAWFVVGDTVLDLSAYDYEATGSVVEFEAKMADGFTKIEFDR